MKANLKGFSGIKGMLLLHGEKLVIIGVGICALMFIYYSTRLERLDDAHQAEKLRQEISLTKTAVTELPWDKAVAEHPDEVRVAKMIDKSAAPEVDPIKYGFGGLNPAVIPSTQLRTDPILVAVEDVRVTGGSGLFSFLDEQVRKERILAQQAEEAQKAKADAKKAEQEQKQQAEGGDRTKQTRDRGRGEDPGYEVDPEHPNRRPIEGVSRVQGAQVMGDERVERAFWAVVVAKVPIKEQLKLYRDAFENTRTGFDPQYDFPRYLGYVVQRAEVRPGQELQWSNIDVYDGLGKKVGQPGKPAPVNQVTMNQLYEVIQKEWAAQTPELVDPRYLDPEGLLAFPLPPLLGRDWGAEITHPDIPLAINAPAPEVETPVETPVQAPGAEEDGFAKPTDPTTNTMRRPGGEMRGMNVGRGIGRGGDDGEGGRGSRGGMRGGRSFLGQGERGGAAVGYRGGEGGANAGVLPKGVDSWLLRFFDFTVEPGKKYKYRVQIVIDDPNNIANNPNATSTTLDSTVLKRLKEAGKGRPNNKPPTYRLADWSAPSPTVGIPLAGSVRLAAAKVPTGKLFNDEPAATLLVESFEKDAKGNAIHAAKEKDLRRGYVANLVEEAEYITPDGRWIDKADSFKFLTGITVVDVAGGEKLTRDMQAPSRVLLLDPAGELYIRSELDDAEMVRLHRTTFAKHDKKKSGESRGEGGFRGRGER